MKILYEDHHIDADTIPFNDFGELGFEDILRPNKLILEQGNKLGWKLYIEDNVDGNAESIIIKRVVKLELEESFQNSRYQVADQDNANVVENTGILLENFGQLLLDGTDTDSSDSKVT